MLVIRGQMCKDYALQKEWLESNLNGSYIYNNLLCHNTLPEHSLLTIPYQNKMLTLVSSVIEEINIDDNVYFTNSLINPDKGNKINISGEDKLYLEKFYIDDHLNFLYNFDGVKLLKSLILVNDKNITILKYKIFSPEKNIKLLISPLISIKEHNTLSQQSVELKKYNVVKEQNYIKFIHSDDVNIFFYFDMAEFKNNKKNIHNNRIKEGETYLCPGDFFYQLTPDNNECYFVIAGERIKEADISTIFNNEIKRRMDLLDTLAIKNELYKNIILAASFYLKRKDDMTFLKNSILNSPISFQVMINSLNILFTLRKIDAIKDLLKFFIGNHQQGIIPEYFDHAGKKNIYNSIDNSFWYLLNVLKFIEHTGDWKFVKDHLWEKIKLIIHNFYNNHIPCIKFDSDGLLLLNLAPNDKFNKGKLIEYQCGKHIALNILWYNTARITELLAAKFADIEYHTRSEDVVFLIKKNFYSKFWNKEKDYFNYRIEIPPDNQNDDSLRPYQIFAASLPFDDLIHYKTKQRILNVIQSKLLTSYGLMTLSADSKNYIQRYDPKNDQSAYNGTIHPYLLFHYVTAILKMNKYSKHARMEVKNILLNFEKKIKTNIVGFFPEFINSVQPNDSAGSMEYSLAMSEYLKIRSEELDSI